MGTGSRALERKLRSVRVGPPRDFARTTFKPRQRALVRVLAEAMFAHDRGPPDGRLDAIALEFDRYVSPASTRMRFAMAWMLWLVRVAPLLTIGRFCRFERLALAERVRVLERMAASPIRVLALVLAAFKAILSLLFFEYDDELCELGYTRERSRYKRALRLVVAPSGTPR